MTAESAQPRVRLRPEERRGQLINIGLRLLVTRPIHEMSIDEVAAGVGISRGLLFHYFPTSGTTTSRSSGRPDVDCCCTPRPRRRGCPRSGCEGSSTASCRSCSAEGNYVALVRAG
ncbi:TetR/AcrR family transcriptional regulator, partial [Streptomyces sp. WM4235]|uniref:TetR/AcrR family transcriptional regulator n=1 Tax=Streptomyces sp. WM4235 TaxID=1415551 RepID=UPI003B6406C6